MNQFLRVIHPFLQAQNIRFCTILFVKVLKCFKLLSVIPETVLNSFLFLPRLVSKHLVAHSGDLKMERYATDLNVSFGFCFYFPLWLFFNFLNGLGLASGRGRARREIRKSIYANLVNFVVV